MSIQLDTLWQSNLAVENPALIISSYFPTKFSILIADSQSHLIFHPRVEEIGVGEVCPSIA